MSTYQNIPAENLPFLYINGMVVSNNATTPNTLIDISAGQCRDSNDVMDIYLSESITINAAANGAINRLDTGTFAASKVYAVYAVGDSSNKLPAGGLLSLASNAVPMMPFGYDSYRLIGYAVSDSSVHFLKAYISGSSSFRLFTFDAPQVALSGGNQTSYTGVALTAFVAPINNSTVYIHVDFNANAAANTMDLQGYNFTGDSVHIIAPVAGATAHTTEEVSLLSQLNVAAPSIKYKVSAGSVSLLIKGFQFFI